MTKMRLLGKKITLDEAIKKAQKDGQTHEAVQTNYAREVKKVETKLGPQIPAMLTPQERTDRGGCRSPRPKGEALRLAGLRNKS
jgi:hypothetical protein